MAYPYYPTYQPNYYGNNNPYLQQMQNQQIMQQVQAAQNAQQPQQPAIQQSGFVPVQSEHEARAYPVAPGNSITFKDESRPYCYVKTMGFNQLGQPTFERYRLVKEDLPSDAQRAPTMKDSASEGKDTAYALKSDVAALWGAVDELKEKVKAAGEKKPVKKKVIEVEADDDEE